MQNDSLCGPICLVIVTYYLGKVIFIYEAGILKTGFHNSSYVCKVEKILKGIVNSILSPSVKIQIVGRKILPEL